ncbi:OmpA family protein [Fulvivirga sp. 29W222]|uniref:OmpA family protein n=1 Tax=Fulvivirga marina TaxID=2494733 RepID=A0A937KD28_9BACT|nr:OmpA family protein [Fulvivirga marina]MBL6448726.1 OmpA family protein [Fulvivirga marina]
MKKIQLLIFLFVYSLIGFSQEYNERYELLNLGRKVNTGYHEGAPVISADGKTLYFFVHNHPDNTYGKEGSQDIWYAELGPDGEWGEAKHMDKPLNQHHSNQVFTVMPDGNTLFIRGGSSRNSKGFSFTRKSGGEWGKPDEIKVDDFRSMNKGKFYGATMSSDGKYMILYMSEKENGTFSDLYFSKAVGDGDWSRPVLLPKNINTGRDEFAPYLAPDNKTMYYSSTRKDMGLGNADIYKTVRLDDTWLKWSDPVNVGRPLNTRAFDSYMSIDNSGNVFTAQSGNAIDGGNLDIFGLKEKDIKIRLRGVVLDAKSKSGVMASLAIGLVNDTDTLVESSGDGSYQTKLIGEGNYHIRVSAEGYYPDEAQLSIKDVFRDTTVIQDFVLKPVKRNTLLTGTVYNAKTEEPLTAKVEIIHKSDKKAIYKKESPKGYFEKELDKKGWYFIAASAEGFINATDSVRNADDGSLLNKDLYLTPIEIGTTVRLNNIFFDFDKTTLKSESYVELDKVVDFLNDNSSVEIEIAGHTDSKGSDDYNLNLSQGRAQAVVDYLIGQGIDEYRLVAKGYGETVPLETNETDEGRAINRRVEFTVLKK